MKRHCPSAKIVSKARDDLPEPETPVTAMTLLCGSLRSKPLRLFCLAPSIMSSSTDIRIF